MSNTSPSTHRPSSWAYTSTASDNSSSTSYQTNHLYAMTLTTKQQQESHNKTIPIRQTSSIAKSELVQSFGSLLTSGKGSDLTITCRGSIFRVHKAIVCLRSEFFTAACWGCCKASQARDHIDLPDHDPAIVRKALRYLYYLNYDYIDPEPTDDDTTSPRSSGSSSSPLSTPSHPHSTTLDLSPPLKKHRHGPLTTHALNNSIGTTYGIPELTTLASQKFSLTLHAMITHGTAARSISDLTEAIYIIFSTTSMMGEEDDIGAGLREQVLEYVQLDLKFLLGLEMFKALLERCPEFGYVLLCREVEEREGV